MVKLDVVQGFELGLLCLFVGFMLCWVWGLGYLGCVDDCLVWWFGVWCAVCGLCSVCIGWVCTWFTFTSDLDGLFVAYLVVTGLMFCCAFVLDLRWICYLFAKLALVDF